MAKIGDDRRNKLRFHTKLGGHGPHEFLGHTSLGARREDVGLDVVFLAFLLEHIGETDDAHLGRAIIGLAEIAEDTGCRAGVDDATILLLAHQLPGCLCHPKGALQVHVQDRIKEFRRHVLEGLVAKNTRIVDHDVHATEGVQRGLDDGLPALNGGDAVAIGHGLAAGFHDLRYHPLGRRG